MKWFVFASFIFSTSGCIFNSSISFTNKHSIRIKQMIISVSNEVVWEGALKSGESLHISFNPKRDGEIRIKGRHNKIDFDKHFGYTTSNGHLLHSFEFKGIDLITYTYAPKTLF